MDKEEKDPATSIFTLEGLHLQNLQWFIFISVVISLTSYLAIVGWLQWYYYICRRDKALDWKCQPDKFLSPDNARHEMVMGCVNMLIGGAVSGVISAYIYNGGYSSLYYNASERGIPYLLLSTALVFTLQDGLGYYAHKMYHHPFLYRNIHKHHHRYHSPTAWSSTAMHPVEFFTYQTVLAAPAFFVPVYWGCFLLTLLYSYYYGVIAHSGIRKKSVWPWQPSSLFHDNHHKYFHCNFGFNLKLWDWIHDTLRRDDRVYSEETFGGKGLVIRDVTKNQ